MDISPALEVPAGTAGSGRSRPLRVLTFSSLYPNAGQPTLGVFVENRVRHLAGDGSAEVRVVAPVPWFPFTGRAFGRYAEPARAPRREVRHGLDVVHPRFLQIPKVGATAAPWLLYRAVRPLLHRMRDDGFDFDVIDSHYLYPDGVAAALLGRAFGRPVTMSARGNDVNLFPTLAGPRRWLRRALAEADAVSTVCAALRDKLVAFGVDPAKLRVIRNGVDLQMFRPVDPEAARRALGLEPPVLVTVGHLIPRKAQHLIIRALPLLPEATLLVVGDGPERDACRAAARTAGVTDRVRFLGSRPQAELPALYSAADVSVLASRSEGLANVLLESMACGTPVVASDVDGNAEAVDAPEAGRLLAARTPEAIAAAVRAQLAAPPDRAAVRAYAEQFDWERATAAQLAMFRDVLAAFAARAAAGAGGR